MDRNPRVTQSTRAAPKSSASNAHIALCAWDTLGQSCRA